MRRLSIVMLLLAAALGGCASLTSDSGVLVETTSGGQPLEGADCTLVQAGQSYTFRTPATLDLGLMRGDIRVLCAKKGFRESELYLREGWAPGGARLSFGMASGRRAMFGLSTSVPLQAGTDGPRIVVEMSPE